MVVTVALGVGLAGQRLLSADPVPAAPRPTTAPHPMAQVPGSLGRLAYGIDGDIYVADADGSNPVRVADGAPGESGTAAGYWGEGPLWSPDGRYLAYRGTAVSRGWHRASVTGPSTSATRQATASRRSLVRAGRSRGRPTPPGSLRGSTSTRGSDAWDLRARRGAPGAAHRAARIHGVGRRRPGVVTRWHVTSTPPRRGDPRRRVHAAAATCGRPAIAVERHVLARRS